MLGVMQKFLHLPRGLDSSVQIHRGRNQQKRKANTSERAEGKKIREEIICQETITKIKGKTWGYKRARREENKLMMS